MIDHVLILNRWPQYPARDRWDNELARPDDLIPHDRYRVTYICDPPGQRGVPTNARDVHGVPDFADVDRVVALAGELINRKGPFDRLIAFSEYLLDIAAIVRETYEIPGPKRSEIDRFRDKIVMKELVRKAGIRVPEWFVCTDPEQVLADARTLGFPLIMKPIRGASSEGVSKITRSEELESICSSRPLLGNEIEEYIAGDLLHADGVIDHAGSPIFICISRYLSPCLEFEHGVPLGSIIETNSEACAHYRRFALDVLAALDLRGSAFHLEFFDTGRELVFLEVGARVAGADVSYVVQETYGVNLFRLWADVVLDRNPQPLPVNGQQSGGWLTIPRPKPLPQRVVHATPLLGKVPLLYRELVPRPEQILRQAGGYANLQGGRFLFRGGTPDEILEAIRIAQSAYRLTTMPMAESP